MAASTRARHIERRLHSHLMAMLDRQAAMLTPEEYALLWELLDGAARRADPSYRTPTAAEIEDMPEPRLTLAQASGLLAAMQAVVSLRPPERELTEDDILAAAAAFARRKALGQ